ncbi:hypothetical protein ASPSYDRAFT_471152 [Aspergillus sydowii CBS 593.65]|uniref:Uncharacterized protein n=1 Tax=Aspergillus sydowii CBS 593.65 TaxID=1036612 RepID=A0A1L9T597_9EURO|nr:uncharacterized protein ASPSYDRAFT_471152 [Aspergillus sydowii CBS 593.65]OJJ54606.1 hypothetical protein ASPSYDRAFT_471152 [Aspergillus sydowii CBS 593.65]
MHFCPSRSNRDLSTLMYMTISRLVPLTIRSLCLAPSIWAIFSGITWMPWVRIVLYSAYVEISRQLSTDSQQAPETSEFLLRSLPSSKRVSTSGHVAVPPVIHFSQSCSER